MAQAELDRTWELTGLDGTVPRPGAVPNLDAASAADGGGMMECVIESGFGSWSWDDDGLTEVNGSAPSPEQTLAWYACTAANPSIDYLSRAQKDYIYDYYTSWLLPCFGFQGYEFSDQWPSRAEFRDDPRASAWQPYYVLTSPPGTLVEQMRLDAACPPTVPGVPGWSR